MSGCDWSTLEISAPTKHFNKDGSKYHFSKVVDRATGEKPVLALTGATVLEVIASKSKLVMKVRKGDRDAVAALDREILRRVQEKYADWFDAVVKPEHIEKAYQMRAVVDQSTFAKTFHFSVVNPDRVSLNETGDMTMSLVGVVFYKMTIFLRFKVESHVTDTQKQEIAISTAKDRCVRDVRATVDRLRLEAQELSEAASAMQASSDVGAVVSMCDTLSRRCRALDRNDVSAEHIPAVEE